MSWPLGAVALALLLGPVTAKAIPALVYDNTASANVQGAQDLDGPKGFAPAEAYVEVNGQSIAYKWFGSATVDGGALEVGVDLTRPLCCIIGSSQAVALADITMTNDADTPFTPVLRLEIPAGEVIIRDVNLLDRETMAYFDVKLRDLDGGTDLFHYRLEINSTNGNFASVATANVPIDSTLGGGSEWGYKTAPYISFIVLPVLEPFGVMNLQYVMEAFGENSPRYREDAAGFSVKLGDPLTLGGEGGMTLVPEPSSGALLAAAALPVLWYRRVAKGWRRKARSVRSSP